MSTIQLSAHVGSDGVLRLEVPVTERDRDVDVILVVRAQDEPPQREGAVPGQSGMADVASLVGENGVSIRFPPPGGWSGEPVAALDGGASELSASDLLVRDRR